MGGTVPYYVEQFMTSIMNRLVENESITLTEQFHLLKQEIEQLDEPKVVKENYLRNLNNAYHHVQLNIKGTEEIGVPQ